MAKPADWYTDRRPWLQEPKNRGKTEDRGKTGQKKMTDKQRTDERNGTEETINTNYKIMIGKENGVGFLARRKSLSI